MIANCPFCNQPHEAPTQVSQTIYCQCGAIGQTDLTLDEGDIITDNNLSDDAIVSNSGVIFEDEDGKSIVLQWAKEQ